jgi:hypothetical protein
MVYVHACAHSITKPYQCIDMFTCSLRLQDESKVEPFVQQLDAEIQHCKAAADSQPTASSSATTDYRAIIEIAACMCLASSDLVWY